MLRVILILSIIALTVAAQRSMLTQLWSQSLSSQVTKVYIGRNDVLVLSDCAYFFDLKTGSLLLSDCTHNSTAAYGYGKFVLVSPYGSVEVYDDYLNLLYSFSISQNFTSSVLILPNDELIACYEGCALYDFYGNEKWESNLGLVLNKPSFNGNLIFVPVNDKQAIDVIYPNGTVLYSIGLQEAPWSIDSCGNLLAVKTSNWIYLFNVTAQGYGQLWIKPSPGPYGDVKFSRDCKYLVVAGSYRVEAYEVNGTKVLEVNLPFSISSIDWNGKVLAIGGFDGSVRLYKLEARDLGEVSSALTTNADQIPSLALLSILFVRKLRKGKR